MGVSNPSSYERKLIMIFEEEKIEYEREKTFSDLRRGLLRYDFFLPQKNVLIELQGQQHFYYIPKFHKGRGDFLKGQERDRKKISFALSHKIPLYCIPYWDMDSIRKSLDIFNEKFLARTRYFNDELYREHIKK